MQEIGSLVLTEWLDAFAVQNENFKALSLATSLTHQSKNVVNSCVVAVRLLSISKCCPGNLL